MLAEGLILISLSVIVINSFLVSEHCVTLSYPPILMSYPETIKILKPVNDCNYFNT